jgi:DNA-binding response OmpR family regulator
MRILVVHRDLSEIGVIARMLSGHRVIGETDPDAAVRRLAAGEQFGLVLWDTQGIDTSMLFDMRLRYGANRPMLVVMMSRYKELAEVYADAILLKPLQGSELRALVATELARNPQAPRPSQDIAARRVR